MDVITPSLPNIRRGTSEPSTLQVTLSKLDREKDQSGSIFSGFAGLLAILLLVAALGVLWNWNKRKKRRVPYRRVTAVPWLTLPQSRQRAHNVYDFLPRRQGALGRRPSRSFCVFSIERLLSRSSDSPPSAHGASQAGLALQAHRAQTHSVGTYDSAPGPQRSESLTPSAHHVQVTASGDHLSISSEDSRDYVNVPTAEEIAETLASTSNPPGSLFVLPSAQELEFTEEGDTSSDSASDRTSCSSPGTEGNDPLSDEAGSSQTSSDYVNTAELGLGAAQGRQPWLSFRRCRDYENVPPADPNGSQQRAEEGTSSNTSHVKGRAGGLGTHVQLVQSGRLLVLGDHVTYRPSAQSESSQMKHRGEMSNEGSNDYDIVLATKLGGGDSEQEPDT